VAHILISGPDTVAPAVWGAVVASWLFTMLLWFTTTPLAARLRPLLRLGRGARADRPDAYYRRPVSPAARPQPDLGDVAVAVDAGRCVRFGFCEREAPDLFRLRDDGRLAFRATVPPGLVDAAVRAAESCPARAIALTRAAAGAFDRWGSDTPAREPRTRPVDVQVSYEPEPAPYEDDYDYDRRYYDDRRR
jgi:sulfoxide reductase heme-binding subunit YedZ